MTALRSRWLRALSAACMALGLAGAAHAQSSWFWLDLGELGGGFVGPTASTQGNAVAIGQSFLAGGGLQSFAYGGRSIYELGSIGTGANETFFVDAAGRVAGQTPGSVGRSFFYEDGQATTLGTFGGSGSYVTNLSASGLAIGYADTAGNVASRAFVYDDGVMRDLGTLGGSNSVASAVNAAGQVVGSAYLAGDSASHAFLWNSGSMRDLGTLGGSNSFASAVNASGLVVGNSYLSGNSVDHAFLWSSGSMLDLGTLGGSFSSAIGVNAAGMVIGNSYLAGDATTRAFLYSGGSMRDLGTLGGSNSYALGVNSFGDVIGLSDVAGNQGQHAFLYTGGRMIDLDSPFAGITRFIAAGINDAMQIIGYGMTSTGILRGFVISPVPEPSGGIGMLLGMAAVATIARRRRA